MIGIGIIGCGAIAKKRYMPVCAGNTSLSKIGFWDRHPDRAEALASTCDGTVYPTLEAMLADASIDAVCVCLPLEAHEAVTLKALAQGKHVLLEKPMAPDLPACLRLAEAQHRAGRQLMIAFSQRFYSEHLKARQWIRDGKIGRVISFRTTLSHRGIEYAVFKAGGRDFFDRHPNGPGVTLDVGSHRVDLMRYLLDSEIDAVLAATPTLDKCLSDGTPIAQEDHCMTVLKLKNGVVGTLWVSWCNYGMEDNSTVIFGERGVIALQGRGRAALYRDGVVVDELEVQPDADEINGCGVVHSFVESINAGESTAISAWDGVVCCAGIDAILRSGKSGRAELVELYKS